MTKPLEGVTVVIPVRDAADALGKILPSWRVVMEKTGRDFEILVVDDGSADAAAVARVVAREPRAKFLRHDTRQGYGTSLRTALAEARYPLFFYTAVDYPYTPSDLRALLDRINLKDEAFGKQPDLISGCRTGIPAPQALWWLVKGWKLLWRVFAGLPTSPSSPWHGWREFRYRTYSRWVFGVPLSDINSCFKLFRTDFLKRVPIQSNGDFVHTELVAKATFLTSIMDEVPLTPKPDAVPALGDIRADKRRVFRDPQFRVPPAPTDSPSGGESPAAAASTSSTPSPVPLP